MSKVAKPKKTQRAEVVEVVETPIAPQFEQALSLVFVGAIKITSEQYKDIRLKMLNETGAKTTYTEGMLQRVNENFASKEFGSEAMELPLRWLWDKYIANKIGNQMVANLVFGVLVQGIEDGYKAIVSWLCGKNTHVAEGLEDAIEIAGKVIESGKIEDFRNEINTHLADIKKLNESDAAQGKKVSFFRKMLNAVKSIFGIN